MKNLLRAAPILLLAACHQEETSSFSLKAKEAAPALPGYWFQIFLIVLPLAVILVKLFLDRAALRESLYGIESQLRRLNSRLEQLEEKTKPAIPGKEG